MKLNDINMNVRNILFLLYENHCSTLLLLLYCIIIIIILFIFFIFLVPSVVKIPRVKNIRINYILEWLTFGVIPIDEGASESNLIETLY